MRATMLGRVQFDPKVWWGFEEIVKRCARRGRKAPMIPSAFIMRMGTFDARPKSRAGHSGEVSGPQGRMIPRRFTEPPKPKSLPFVI
jgi:hypothetical protein